MSFSLVSRGTAVCRFALPGLANQSKGVWSRARIDRGIL